MSRAGAEQGREWLSALALVPSWLWLFVLGVGYLSIFGLTMSIGFGISLISIIMYKQLPLSS